MGPKISKQEFDGCEALLLHGGAAKISLADMAYVLATTYHETAGTMAPVIEANWLSKAAREKYYFRMYDIHGARPAKAKELGNIYPGDGVKFCGRGFPQVTGRDNYRKLSRLLGIDLEANPDRLLETEIAAQATIIGMVTGLFTGKDLDDTLPRDTERASVEQYKQSRRIINGTDKDDEIAIVADVFEEGLVQGGYA